MATVGVNGERQPSLAEQLDRLDRILDGLAEALNEAVANAVKQAVGPAAKEAVTVALDELKRKQARQRPRIVVHVLYGAAVAVRLARCLPPGGLPAGMLRQSSAWATRSMAAVVAGAG
jgi:hypothetical protein